MPFAKLNRHPVHGLGMDAVMPNKAAEKLAQRPFLIEAAREPFVF